MKKGAIFAGLVAAAILVGSSAQGAEDRNRPKCDFHVFTDMNDHWALTEGTPKRKWLVMNVGDASVLVSGSEVTTPGHPEHEEMIATGQSTIATMKYGQPQITLAPVADNTMATGNVTTGDNVTDAGSTAAPDNAAPATATAGASADATSTTATTGGNTMAAGSSPPTTKTTVVICRFFERKR